MKYELKKSKIIDFAQIKLASFDSFPQKKPNKYLFPPHLETEIITGIKHKREQSPDGRKALMKGRDPVSLDRFFFFFFVPPILFDIRSPENDPKKEPACMKKYFLNKGLFVPQNIPSERFLMHWKE